MCHSSRSIDCFAPCVLFHLTVFSTDLRSRTVTCTCTYANVKVVIDVLLAAIQNMGEWGYSISS